MGGSSDEGEGEELDPRVEGALGDLNRATDDINVAEKAYEDAKKGFKDGMTRIQVDLRALAAKCGRKNIDKARPYHEALFKARKSHFESRHAAQAYEQASEMQRAAKADVARFEAELGKTGGAVDTQLLVKLNNASQAVAEADRRKRRAAHVHGVKTKSFLAADEELMALAKTRKRVILKTQPYFSCKEGHDRALAGLKKKVETHEAEVKDSKARVAAALKLLESISTEIHESRQARKMAEANDGAVDESIAARIAEEKAEMARRDREDEDRRASGDGAIGGEDDDLKPIGLNDGDDVPAAGADALLADPATPKVSFATAILDQLPGVDVSLDPGGGAGADRPEDDGLSDLGGDDSDDGDDDVDDDAHLGRQLARLDRISVATAGLSEELDAIRAAVGHASARSRAVAGKVGL